jgi:hypothetical protein
VNRIPFISALIAAAFGAAEEVGKNRSSVDLRSFFRKRGGRNRGRFTKRLRHDFAQNAKERFGLDTLIDGRPDPDVVRVMRNARKRERQAP